MVGRLGRVLYWIGCIAALGCVAYGISQLGSYIAAPEADRIFHYRLEAVLSVGAALACWLAGFMTRYVLTPK
jgi:hypothetical protein